MKTRISKLTAMHVVLFLSIITPAQSGGNFAITQSVISSGGQTTSGGLFSVDGSTGQTIAGNEMSNSPYAVTSGFWNYTPSSPTAARVTVSGSVRTRSGNGIRNVLVTLTSLSGTEQTAVTGSFGYFHFENVEAGESYIISVFSRRFTFSQPTQVCSVFDDVVDLIYIADNQ